MALVLVSAFFRLFLGDIEIPVASGSMWQVLSHGMRLLCDLGQQRSALANSSLLNAVFELASFPQRASVYVCVCVYCVFLVCNLSHVYHNFCTARIFAASVCVPSRNVAHTSRCTLVCSRLIAAAASQLSIETCAVLCLLLFCFAVLSLVFLSISLFPYLSLSFYICFRCVD